MRNPISDLSYMNKTHYNPYRHGIFKYFTFDCTSEYTYDNTNVTQFQETLSKSNSLTITPLRVGSTEYFCISTTKNDLDAVRTALNQMYVLETNPFAYNDVAFSVCTKVIFSTNEDYISLLYILLKNRIQYNTEFKIHDLCVYHDGALKVGVICGIGDNSNKETIYNVKPQFSKSTKSTRKTFNHSEVSPVSNFRKYYNLPNTDDIFFMDFTADVDKGMYLCGF